MNQCPGTCEPCGLALRGRSSVPTTGPPDAWRVRWTRPAGRHICKRLGHDGCAHLARAHRAIAEDNGHLFDVKAFAVALVHRGDLEGVAFQMDGLKVERL